MPLKRHCYKCNTLIVYCNGFIKAGDIVEGALIPRELCGRCALIYEKVEINLDAD